MNIKHKKDHKQLKHHIPAMNRNLSQTSGDQNFAGHRPHDLQQNEVLIPPDSSPSSRHPARVS